MEDSLGLSVLETFIACCEDSVLETVLTPLDVHNLASVHCVLGNAVDVRFGNKEPSPAPQFFSTKERADIARRLSGCTNAVQEHPIVFPFLMDALAKHKAWVRRLLCATARRPLSQEALKYLFPEEEDYARSKTGVCAFRKVDDFGGSAFVQSTVIVDGVYVTITSGYGIHRSFMSTWWYDGGLMDSFSRTAELGVVISQTFGVRPKKMGFDSKGWPNDSLVLWVGR